MLTEKNSSCYFELKMGLQDQKGGGVKFYHFRSIGCATANNAANTAKSRWRLKVTPLDLKTKRGNISG